MSTDGWYIQLWCLTSQPMNQHTAALDSPLRNTVGRKVAAVRVISAMPVAIMLMTTAALSDHDSN